MAETKEKDRAPVAPPLTKKHQSMTVAGDTDVELLDDVEAFASTNMITDAATLAAGAPTAASQLLANNPNGPIQDLVGNNGLVLNHVKETAALLKIVKQVTDATDPMAAKLDGVISALTGGGSPSGTVITDLTLAVNTGPNAATQVKANAPAGPIQDWVGNVNGANIMLKETKTLLATINRGLDSGDPLKATVANLAATLV